MDFTDLEAFQALPRLSGLALSPDGSRLVTSVATLDAKKQKWVNALWEVDPTGAQEARRLTRSAKGESSPVFAANGDLLFTSTRPEPDNPEGNDDKDDKPSLWLLPAAGGEAHQIAYRAGGVAGPRTAGDVVVVSSDTLPGSTDDDKERRKARADRKISAILHTGYPVRLWDHDLGPGEPRLVLTSLSSPGWTDLTPTPARALDDATYDLTPDGSHVVTTWTVSEPRGSRRTTLVLIDATTGEQRVLADNAEHEYEQPRVSPDGTWVACLRTTRSRPDQPGDVHLAVLALDGGAERVIGGWDRWPTAVRWTADGTALLVTADEDGRGPVFRVSLEGDVRRLTTDDGHYTDLCVGPDAVYALRDSVDSPPTPVRLDPEVPGPPSRLPSPATAPELRGRLEEISTTSGLRAWLALPEGAGPHPVVLWVHGGPLSSWNSWSWRWCPWLLVAHGYAVLLPDPALSTGYGRAHIARGWGDWGGATYEDVLQVCDAALQRPDLDPTRTAMMGGSFGGYMANWIAGHTDRFRAIVTHASLWALKQFGPTTDGAWYWRREMTPEMVAKNDPSQFADKISTPMLVIHGDRDYRVPIGEGLRLWWDLCSRAEDPATMPHRFLYFPDENHWVLSPGHAVVWYQTVLAFLGEHVLGRPAELPELLK